MITNEKTCPTDRVLIEAAKRSGWRSRPIVDLRSYYNCDGYHGYRALCDMIQKYEQPPKDRKTLCVEEAIRRATDGAMTDLNKVGLISIELWDEGFDGK